MRVGVYPGSFDPVTLGHLDIVARAARLFDVLYVAVLANSQKSPLFTAAERVEMLQEATAHHGNVRCETFNGLVVEYAGVRRASAIVRGLRAVSDFEYEFRFTSMNRHLRPDIEILYMMTATEFSFVSSSIVKEVAALGGDVTAWVPPGALRRLQAPRTDTHGQMGEKVGE